MANKISSFHNMRKKTAKDFDKWRRMSIFAHGLYRKENNMNAISLNNLWVYLQGLSLSASNQRWLGERLIEASATQTTALSDEEQKLKKLNALFGVWSDLEGEQIEAAVMKSRVADYERELVSMDE